jgi:hypothetical protein
MRSKIIFLLFRCVCANKKWVRVEEKENLKTQMYKNNCELIYFSIDTINNLPLCVSVCESTSTREYVYIAANRHEYIGWKKIMFYTHVRNIPTSGLCIYLFLYFFFARKSVEFKLYSKLYVYISVSWFCSTLREL